MDRNRLLLVIAASTVLCTVLQGSGTGFDRTRFEIIVAAKPFGEKPKSTSTGSGGELDSKNAPSARFTDTLRLTMIRRSDVIGDVCALGDTKNPEWHAYLGAGESQDGITAKKIDYAARGVLLSKNGLDEWIFLSNSGTAGDLDSTIPEFAKVLQRLALNQHINAPPPPEESAPVAAAEPAPSDGPTDGR